MSNHTWRNLGFIIIFAALAFLLLPGAPAKAQSVADCDVDGYWSPWPGPYHKEGGTTFTFHQKYKMSGQDWSNDHTWTCTTGPKDGDTCWVAGVYYQTWSDWTTEGVKFCLIGPMQDSKYTSAARSPQNRIDADGPDCGPWSGSGAAGDRFRLLSPSDALSGLKSDNVYTCPSAGSCTLTILDNALNSTDCKSLDVVPIPKDPTGKPTCFPATQTVKMGETASLSAESTKTSDTLYWSGGESPDPNGTGASFSTSFSTVGTKTITVSTDPSDPTKQTTCTVIVEAAPPDCGRSTGNISISSNKPATWTLSGPSTKSQVSPATSGSYDAMPAGAYTLTPGDIPGFTVTVSPVGSQTLLGTCGSNISFSVDYQPIPPDPVKPPAQSGTITVTSNKSTTWNLYLASQAGAYRSQTTPNTSVTYSNMPGGSYSLAAEVLPNFTNPTVSYNPGQDLGGSVSSIAININYGDSPVGPCQFAFGVAPFTQTIKVGEVADYVSWSSKYDCPNPFFQYVTASTNWSDNPADIAQSMGAGRFKGLKAGPTEIKGVYGNKNDTASLTVLPANIPDFSCVPNPNYFIFVAGVGGEKSGMLDCTSLNGFAGTINFSIASSTPTAYAMARGPLTLSAGGSGSRMFDATATRTIRRGLYNVGIRGTASAVWNGETIQLSHDYDIQVRATNDLLSAALTPVPASGDKPLNTTLNGMVAGGYEVCENLVCPPPPTINYTFWSDCPVSKYSGKNVAEAEAACGQSAPSHIPGGKFDNEPSEIKALPYAYQEAGTYYPLLIVERGGQTARATATVTVAAPATHAECLNNACVQVGGGGPNRCSVNADCGGSPGTGNPVFHGECDASQQACINKAGGGPSTCNADTCGISRPTYLTCQDNACVLVSGAGTNEAGCTTVGATCTTENLGGSCQLNATPKIVKKGDATTLNWTCNASIRNCILTAPGGRQVASGNSTGQGTDSPSATTQYTLTCNRGAYSVPVTVYVVQSYEETNPGGR